MIIQTSHIDSRGRAQFYVELKTRHWVVRTGKTLIVKVKVETGDAVEEKGHGHGTLPSQQDALKIVLHMKRREHKGGFYWNQWKYDHLKEKSANCGWRHFTKRESAPAVVELTKHGFSVTLVTLVHFWKKTTTQTWLLILLTFKKVDGSSTPHGAKLVWNYDLTVDSINSYFFCCRCLITTSSTRPALFMCCEPWCFTDRRNYVMFTPV